MTASFRLATVLRVRRRELERATLAHRVAVERAEQARTASAEAELRADVARSRMRQALQQGLSAARLRTAAEVLTHWEARIGELEREAADAGARLDEQRDVLLEARRRVRTLERLEQEHEARVERERARREQKELDEVGVRRARVVARWVLVGWLAGLWLAPASVVRAEDAADEVGSGDPAVAALLTELRARESELERREQELDDRERNVGELERAANEQLVELERIADTVERRIAAWEEDNGDSVRRLSKIYAAMAPGRAAALLEELDVSLATQIVAKMKHKQSAAVMTQISEDRALAMSKRVAHPLGMTPARTPASKEK